MSKRIFCLVLAMMLTLGASVSALASETSPGSVETNGKINSLSGSATAELKGTIKVTNLEVTVPTQVPFLIDPSANSAEWSSDRIGWSTEQIMQPDNITITNDSIVPVEILVADIEWSEYMNDTIKKRDDFGYNDDMSAGTDWDSPRQLLLGMYARGGSYESGAICLYDTVLYKESGVDLNPGYKYGNFGVIKRSDNEACFVDANGGRMSLKLWGRASQKGWTDGEDFSVTVTLVASVYTGT